MKLRKVTAHRYPQQVFGMHHLVTAGELDPVNPDTIRRYSKITKAAKNIGRLIARRDMSAYLIHDGNPILPMGIATVFPGQTVEFLDGVRVGGVHNVDYALTKSATDEQHRMAAIEVIKASALIAYAEKPFDWSEANYAGPDTTHTYAVNIDMQNPRVNRGFTMLSLQEIGGSFITEGTDYDRITAEGTTTVCLYDSEVIDGVYLTRFK